MSECSQDLAEEEKFIEFPEAGGVVRPGVGVTVDGGFGIQWLQAGLLGLGC